MTTTRTEPLGRPFWVVWCAGAVSYLLTSMVVSSLMIIAFGVFSSFLVIALAVTVLGLASTWWNVVTITLRQRIVPPALLGRVTSVYRMVAFCAAPLGAVAAGLLAHRTTLSTPYWAMGLLQLVATLVIAPIIRRELNASGHPGSAGRRSGVQ